MTIDDLLRYAPDARALEGARRLFFSRRWQVLAGDGQWIWGEFNVDSPRPLRAAVQLLKAEFHCSCRSKRRPCVHTLALLLKLKNRPDEWTVAQPPSWVQQLKSPGPKADVADLQTSSISFAPSAERLALMTAGLEDLELRLQDIMRQGLADSQQLEALWQEMAARLTDAKLAGPASRIRRLLSPEVSPEMILRTLGDLFLLCRVFQQLDRLSPERQAELFRQLGVAPKKDLVLLQPGKEDLWLVMGVTEGIEDRLRFRRVWLRGEQRKRYGLLIDYAFGDQPFERSWPLASAWQGAIHYYPGVYPQRCLFPTPRPANRPYDGLSGYPDFSSMQHDYSRALALQPWLPNYPVYLESVVPQLHEGEALLRDSRGHAYPVSPAFSGFYALLAASAGQAITIFGSFDGREIWPLSLLSGSLLVKV